VTKGKKVKMEFKEVRGQKGIKTAKIDLNGTLIKVGVVSGLENAVKVIKGLNKEYKDYACIEVMACSGGCINGGGQPLSTNAKIRQARANGLYKIDNQKVIRLAHQNPIVKKIYKDYLTTTKIRHQICHTKYSPKKI
ncbi:MAG: iron hydrogenase small subunit, partial [Candidatus Gribaldobacteria bacterium]|nr:iron hydrogenase small subunit [Candidatus Gribaldobacteria bacterium]